MSSFVLKKELIYAMIDQIVDKYHCDSNNLLQILLDIQEINGHNYIPEETGLYVCKKLGIPITRLYSVITFYDALSPTPRGRHVINICNGTSCSLNGYKSIKDIFEEKLGIEVGQTTEDEIFTLQVVPCFGACDVSPAAKIDRTIYGHLNEEKIVELIEKLREDANTDSLQAHLQKCNLEGLKIPKTESLITNNFGKYDGFKIDDYIKLGGFDSLKKAFEMGYKGVIDEVTNSGLRGRGGAQYPTGKKLSQARDAKGQVKYVICNADEGEPGTFKDRELLKNDPYKVIEGMVIASYVAEATEGIIYCREEYKWMHDKIENAINECYKKGYLGKNILNSGHDFNIKLFSGAGAYVCGEGFALCESLEGKPGLPRTKPPFVKQAGFMQMPTLIINVETLSAIASFLSKGANEFAKHGTSKCPGTKVISVCGKVNNPGAYEIPFGLTLREIIEDIAGGVKNNKKINFLQIGGASGGIIPGDLIDTSYDYNGMESIGISVGSGAIVVADEDDDIVEYIRTVQNFFAHESCGSCTPCREGNKQLKMILTKYAEGKATKKDLEKYLRIVNTMKEASLCGSGKTEAVPLLSVLKYFEKEINEKLVN